MGRTLHVRPYNLEAEESVLGACLLSREAVANVLEVVRADDFYKPAHTEMFNAMLELYGRGDPIDGSGEANENSKGCFASTLANPGNFANSPRLTSTSLPRR